MKTMIKFITLHVLALSHQAFAASPSPDGAAHLCVYKMSNEMRVALHGSAAESLFNFLNDSAIEESTDARGTISRRGEGVLCRQSVSKATLCYQSFLKDGSSSSGLPPFVELPEGLPYAEFRFHGAKAQKLFDFMDGGRRETIQLTDEIHEYHMGQRITCIRVERQGLSTYSCSQNLISNGVAWGDGTDPIVNVGTRGLTLDFADPALVSEPAR